MMNAAQQQAIVNARRRLAQENAQKQVTERNQSQGWVKNLGESAVNALKDRALGVGELGLNLADALGVDVSGGKELVAEVQRDLARDRKGRGVAGFVGQVVGDPLTFAPGVGAAGAKTVGGLAKAGAIGGALAGATSSTGDESSNIRSNMVNSLIGGGVGGALGAGVGLITQPGAKAATKVAKDARGLLSKEGIDLTAGQKINNRIVKQLEGGIAEKQQNAFNRAALRRAGITAKTLSPDIAEDFLKNPTASPAILDDAAESFGRRFSDMTKKTGVNVDMELISDLANVESEISRRLGKDATKQIASYIDDILNQGSRIGGDVYQNTRSQLGKLSTSTQDALLAQAYKGLKTALDDAANRSIPKSLAKQAAQLRKEYSAFKVIENAVSRLGDEAAGGDITPAALTAASRVKNTAFSRGKGPLTDLARAARSQIGSKIRTVSREPDLSLSGIARATAGGLVSNPIGQKIIGGVLPESVRGVVGGAGVAGGLRQIMPETKTQEPNAVRFNDAQMKAIEAARQRIGQRITGGTADNEIGGGGGTDFLGSQKWSDERKKYQEFMDSLDKQYEGRGPYDWGAMQQQEQAPDSLLDRIAQAESSGNPNAKNARSSASGLFQYTDGTWGAAVKQYGKELGIKYKDKNSPEAQRAITQALIENEYVPRLSKALGREPMDGEIYLAHFAGASGAVKLLKSNPKTRASSVLPSAAKANPQIFYDGKTPRTVAQVLEILQKKVA